MPQRKGQHQVVRTQKVPRPPYAPEQTPKEEARQKPELTLQENGPDPIVRVEPAPSSPVSIGIMVLTTLAVICALYVGKEVVLPIALALVLKLMLQPIMHFLCDRLRIPQSLAAVLLIICVFGAVAVVALTISGPASSWIQKIPEILPDVKQKLQGLRQPIEHLQRVFSEVESMATSAGQEAAVPTVAVKDGSGVASVASTLALGTISMLSRFFATMVVLFFLLAAGDRLLRGLIEVLPRFSDKRQAATIATEIQHHIGGYLLTITVMNALVGIATGLAMHWSGLRDPILWGSLAFLLNYVPILGPLTGIGIFLVAGIVTLDWPWSALMPAELYLLIHILEGEMITPMLLASRFKLNAVLVIVSLFFWHALWGIPGALLAVPMLATFKIVCDHIEPLKPAAHIIGS
jgi:predicted PurR-regulated permease PerM